MMKRKLNRLKLTCLTLGLAALVFSCGGETKQMSGIVASVAFDTIACKPFEREVLFRNPNTEEAQRFMGVYIEPGSLQNTEPSTSIDPNEEPKFSYRLTKVTVNNKDYPVLGGAAADILVPPGSNVVATVSYNPQEITKDSNYHRGVLTFLFNGPDLGVVQYELLGRAETMYEGCGEGPAGDVYSFTVDQVDFTIVGQGFDNNQFSMTIPGSEISRPFRFYVVDGVATMRKDEFPEFQIDGDELPAALTVTLSDNQVVGTFDGSSLVFDPITVAAPPIEVPGVMSTGTVSLTGDPDDISLQLTGSPFDGNTMEVVFVGNSDNPIDEALAGSVAGATFYLTAE